MFAGAPIYGIVDKPGHYMYDDSDNPNHETLTANSFSTADSPPLPGDFGDGGEPIEDPWPPMSTRNYEEFAALAFSLIDTNDAAVNDTNLYNACVSFPADTNTYPTLQIALYGTNAVIIKANHFDYSAETDRDFALLISDSPDKPTWKSIDLSGASDAQDGWLIEGLVSNWKVTDTMFMLVTNITSARSAVFRAIPYGGPLVALSGPSNFDTVSNTITLEATVSDLSGVTNEQFAFTLNGLLPKRFTRTNNTFTVDTRYAPTTSAYGLYNDVALSVINTNARLFDPQDFDSNIKTAFGGTATLSLDFENPIYLWSDGDLCETNVGTNYIVFGIDQAQNVMMLIKEPASGRVVSSNFVSATPPTVAIPWNFTDSNGAPYTNDDYGVTFQAMAAATSLAYSNRIERYGVRQAAGNIITYEEEDPSTSAGPFLNDQANQWVTSLAFEYDSLYFYDSFSLTLFSDGDIGTGRDNPQGEFPYVLTGSFQLPWGIKVCTALTNLMYSDFNYYVGHGNGVGIGGGPRGTTWVTNYLDTSTVFQFAHAPVPNWRLRKVAIWACYSDAALAPVDATGGGTYPDWLFAFGIRSTREQSGRMISKNVALLFGGELPQGGFSGTFHGTSVEVAANFDDLWITGPTPAPGSCDPTYAFAYVYSVIRAVSPEIDKGKPNWIGFGYLPYTGIYDAEIFTNNVNHIKIR